LSAFIPQLLHNPTQPIGLSLYTLTLGFYTGKDPQLTDEALGAWGGTDTHTHTHTHTPPLFSYNFRTKS
jgi:hypothetical protein